MRAEKKVYIIIGAVIVLAIFAAWFGERKESEFVAYEDYNDFLETVSTNPLIAEKQIEDYTNNLIEAYTNDTYGGDTPEETLALFIDALKNGDTDLAAKYFVVEKQERLAEELGIGLERGHITGLIDILEKEKISKRMSDIKHRFRTFDENNVAEFSFDLIKNEYSPVWKIESL